MDEQEEPEPAARFPIDYDTAEKGDRISAEACEAILGCSRDTRKYTIGMWELVGTIQRELAMRDKQFTVRQLDYGIAILTDEEASAYNASRFDHYRGGIARAHMKMSWVDVGNLDPDVAATHDRQLRNQGLIMASVIAAERRAAELNLLSQQGQLAGPEAE